MKLANLGERLRTFADSRIDVRTADGSVVSRRFGECRRDVDRAVSRLRELGLGPGFRVGLYAQNCYEWIVLDLACIELQLFLVAFGDDTFHATPLDAMFGRYGIAVLFTDAPVAGSGQHPVRDLAQILQVSTAPAPLMTPERSAPLPEDCFSLGFSSGSTGLPKGIMVSRVGAEFIMTAFLSAFGICEEDGICIFLPLANFQQRLLVYASLYAGANVALTTSDGFFHDLKVASPSFFVAPPVLFKNVLKLFELQRDGGESLPALLGGRLRFALVGMAPVEPEVIQAFHDHGVLLLESYGLSESGVIAWNTPERCRIGTVGVPLDAREVSLAEDGEVLVRRRTPLCLGYFDPRDNLLPGGSSTFRQEGVIATGDLGSIDADGYLVLTGRKKNLVVTASGHKFPPEPIEKRINLIAGVNATIVHHSRARQRNVAIVNLQAAPDAQMSATLRAGIDAINRTLPEYQRIALTLVNHDDYSTANHLLTDNFKLHRQNIIDRYAGD